MEINLSTTGAGGLGGAGLGGTGVLGGGGLGGGGLGGGGYSAAAKAAKYGNWNSTSGKNIADPNHHILSGIKVSVHNYMINFCI